MAQTARGMVSDFETMVESLIREVARYAAEGPGPGSTEEEGSANIRRIRVWVVALNSALQGVQASARPMASPAPEPPPEPEEPPIEAAARVTRPA